MYEIVINHLLCSATAARYGICNRPSAERAVEVMDNLKELVLMLNFIQRDLRRKVVVTSGYRSEELNKVVGGVPNSQHVKGQAVDFYVEGMTAKQVAAYVKQFYPYDQLIVYNNKARGKGGLIHLSYVKGGHNRKQYMSIG